MLTTLLPLLLHAPAAVPFTLWAWKQEPVGRVLRLTFSDPRGDHEVRFELTPVTRTRGDERRQQLTVVHALGAKEVFRAKDFVEACGFDLTLELLEGGLAVTDLDGDGEPEVTFAYRLGCRSDVSPLDAKLLLYEGGTKYALRGSTRERVGEDEYLGGDFKPAPAEASWPAAFLAHAQQVWKRVVTGAP